MTPDWISYDRYEDAIAAAAKDDKPILIYFHSKSCDGCRRLEREVLGDERVAHLILETTVPVWVEVETDHPDPTISSLVGSHIFIMSPVVQLISSSGDIFHKFLGAPLHTRLDLGYNRVHHDVTGDINASEFLAQLALGLGKRHIFCGAFAEAEKELAPLVREPSGALAAQEAAYWWPVAQNAGLYPEEMRSEPEVPAQSRIAKAVRRFCSLICRIPDNELMADWPGKPGEGGWAHYTDCLREVCLAAYQTLLDAGNEATRMRQQPLSQTQLILKDWHVSYRTLQGTIHGLSCIDWDRQHLHENYSLGKQRTIRNNIVHCVMAEFWAHGSAIRAARLAYSGSLDHDAKPIGPTLERYGPPPVNFGTIVELLTTWELRHNQLVSELSTITDAELDFQRSWWEGSDVTIRFRLNRLGWHLQDHAAVVETICERIGRVRSETERLAVRIFTALGIAEGATIGMAEDERRAALSDAASLMSRMSEEIESLYAGYWKEQTGAPTAAVQQRVAAEV